MLQFERANVQGNGYPSALHAKIAAQIMPSDFANLVEHDPDPQFRGRALFDFGYVVAPEVTFPVLARLVQNDPHWNVRLGALFSVQAALGAGRLKRRKAEAEQLGLTCIDKPVLRIEAIVILSYCHDQKARRALESIIRHDKDANIRAFAKKALLGQVGPGIKGP